MYENKNDQPERAVLVAVDTGEYDADILLDELAELAQTAGAEVLGRLTQRRESPDPATCIGSGRLEELKEFCLLNGADLIIFDCELSPVQQRNIEKITDIRTIDRTLLILDIFASRARSGEGRLQVDLARMKYLLPRLTGQGLGLSRQGGIGMRRGAGESKLESDRRHIRRRIDSYERQLTEIERRRELLRRKRRKDGIPTVAVVGYTNAGKSTLMNALTNAGVLAENMLFATLDSTSRALKLPDGRTVLLIDTVGFIRRLPHQLVKAFRSTLEEAAYADVILNVCDASSPESEEHLRVTEELLREIGCEDSPIITVLNKCDLLDSNEALLGRGDAVCISAVTGEGLELLTQRVAKALPPTRTRVKLLLPFSRGADAANLRRQGTVHGEEYTPDGLLLDCTVDFRDLAPLSDFVISE